MAGVKYALRQWCPTGSHGRWLLSGLKSAPIGFILSFCRSVKATYKLTGKIYPVKVRVGIGQRLNVFHSSASSVCIDGNIFVNSWGGNTLSSSISCANGATLKILGDFEIGPGVHISVGDSGTLVLGGRRESTGSGITANSRIMVEKYCEIGADCLIAWDVFISDSDWHNVVGSERNDPVLIGDNVWIAHGVSVTKGSTIPQGCIVGAKSLVLRGPFSEKSFIAGVPAIVRRTGVEWFR